MEGNFIIIANKVKKFANTTFVSTWKGAPL
jgi:hypothetical protein